MLRLMTAWLAVGLAAAAAELKFDFNQTKLGECPLGFLSSVTGSGKPGEWKIVLDDVASSMPAFPGTASRLAKQSVLAQLSRDTNDEHFPLLIHDGERFGDFTFSTKIKTVAGQFEQMAGVAFRLQNASNYYVVRVSSLGNNIRFYKVVNGVRSPPIGPDLRVPREVWHDLVVTCKGAEINVSLNGKQAIPTLTDHSFSVGKIAFWTKSDSVSYFANPRITFTPKERLLDVLMRDTLKEFEKLQGLKLYVLSPEKNDAELVASKNPADVGQRGGKEEKTCLEEGTPYVGKARDHVTVMMPIRDRNGDVVAAVKVIMNTFLGQTEQNALNRARPIVRFMENRVLGANEPLR